MPITSPLPVPQPPEEEVLPELDTRIPGRAYEYRRMLRGELRRKWGLGMPLDTIPISAGTIHQESSWNSKAQSPWAKGLTQFTDPTWSDMIRIDPSIAELGDIWQPTAAIRAMVTYHYGLWNQFTQYHDDEARWAFVLSGYNGGPGWVRRDMRMATQNGRDPSRWWGHVEMYSPRSPAAFNENRTYVRNIIQRWIPLYARY